MMLIAISVFAGAMHMLAPDHWMPVSLVSWQRRWSAQKTAALGTTSLFFHLGLAVLIYLCLRPILLVANPHYSFPLSVLIVMAAALVRAAKFPAIRDVLLIGPNRFWGSVTVFSLLGPAESLIPILIKGEILEQNLAHIVLAYAAGTVLSGLVMMTVTQELWNSPRRFNQTITWALNRKTFFPAATGIALALAFILKQ